MQFILAGWQSGTVYKSVKTEANAAAAAAIAIIKGRKVPGVNGKVSGTPSILLTPGLDHEEELQDPLHGRLPEEEPGLRRRVQEVLQ